ncbi:MAG TPA: hypothetical protein VGN15_11085 [Ktedonobacteraceae bacterium]|nr:hypothetical protein [Ktedonobacteraceae bacterium]
MSYTSITGQGWSQIRLAADTTTHDEAVKAVQVDQHEEQANCGY